MDAGGRAKQDARALPLVPRPCFVAARAAPSRPANDGSCESAATIPFLESHHGRMQNQMNSRYSGKLHLLMLLLSFFALPPALAEDEAGLKWLKRDLAEATTVYEKAIRRCTPARGLSRETIRQIRELGLPRSKLIRSLGWLALERRAACERPERQALAETVIRLRAGLLASRQDTGNVDRLADTLWGDALRLAVLRAEYESLPETVHQRIDAIAELRQPFDLSALPDALPESPDTARTGSSLE